MGTQGFGGRSRVAGPIGISAGSIRWPPGRPAARFWHGGCFDSPVWGRCMSFRPFTSESYSEDARPEAWRDVLSAVGLQPSAGSGPHTGHATASPPTATCGALARLGGLGVGVQRDSRAVVLSVTSDALHGRKVGKPAFNGVRVLSSGGFTE